MDNKVVVLGDSLFKGVVYDIDKNRYRIQKPCVDIILENQKMIVDNFSRFGMTTDKALDFIKDNLLKENDYKYAIIELGGNDCDFNWQNISENPKSVHYPNVKIEDFECNMAKIIEEVRKKEIEPLLVTLPPISSSKYFNWFSKSLNKDNILSWLKDENYIYKHHEMYSLCLYNLAYKLGVKIIDLRFTLLNVRDFERYLCVDGIHLNEAGHKFIELSYSKGELRNE